MIISNTYDKIIVNQRGKLVKISKLMTSQSKLLSHNETHLKSILNSIDICNSTSYKAPEKLK